MLCEVDGCDLCEADEGKPVTAHSSMPQLSPCFSESSQTAKTFFFLVARLLKVKTLQPYPGKLVALSEADGSDLRVAEAVS